MDLSRSGSCLKAIIDTINELFN